MYTQLVTSNILPIFDEPPVSDASFFIDSPTVVLSVGTVYSVLSEPDVVNGTRCCENSISVVPMSFRNVQVVPFK